MLWLLPYGLCTLLFFYRLLDVFLSLLSISLMVFNSNSVLAQDASSSPTPTSSPVMTSTPSSTPTATATPASSSSPTPTTVPAKTEASEVKDKEAVGDATVLGATGKSDFLKWYIAGGVGLIVLFVGFLISRIHVTE